MLTVLHLNINPLKLLVLAVHQFIPSLSPFLFPSMLDTIIPFFLPPNLSVSIYSIFPFRESHPFSTVPYFLI